MTPKQKVFVEEYLKDFNATNAAIRAGYSPNTANKIGSENLSKPDIKKEIGIRMNEISKLTDITAEKILDDLEMIKQLCINPQTVKDSNGNVIGISKFDPLGALKACELQGKYIGMWIPKEKKVEKRKPLTLNYRLRD